MTDQQPRKRLAKTMSLTGQVETITAMELRASPGDVLLQAQRMAEHHCHAIGCGVNVPPKMHMCLTHWRMVPKVVQDLIWKHYRAGQEIDKQPTIDYIATAFVSISCVALKEGKPLPTLGK